MKLKFTLNTTPELFATWLLHHTAENKFEGKLDFRSDEGRIVLDPAEYKPPLDNLTYFNMFGHRITRLPEGGETREELPPVIQFVAVRVGSERLEMTAACDETAVMEYFEELLSEMGKSWPGSIPEPPLEDTGMPRGPTIKTRERAQVIRKLKDQHPQWTQYKVAQEASKELREIITADAVRYAYRVMGWKWGRADRMR